MNQTREGIYFPEAELTFSLDYKELYERLIVSHNQAKVLDEESRVEEKIQAYGHVLDITGQLHSLALEEKEAAYALRKEKESDFYFMYREGRGTDEKKNTQKDAEYKTQKDLIPFRQKEAEWIKNAKRWENAVRYIYEQINILKKVQNRQHIELNQLNQNRGRA